MLYTKKSVLSDRVRGFTLIEVLVVIAIIGILAGVGVFQAYESKQKAKNAAIAVEVNSIRLAEELIYSERESYIDPTLARADAPSAVERDIKRVWDHIGVLSGGKQESAVFDASGKKQPSIMSALASENSDPEESADENKEADKDNKDNKDNKTQKNASWAIAVKLPSYTTGSGYYASPKKSCEFSWPEDNGSVNFSLAETCNAVPKGTEVKPPEVEPVPPIAVKPVPPAPPIMPLPNPAPVTIGNGVSITAVSSGQQIGRPFTISRVFKQGEIKDFPQAKVSGTPVLTQADVKSRWPDNSVKHAIASFVTDISSDKALNIDFVNQVFGNNSGEMSKAAMLAYSGGNWGAAIDTTVGTANVRAMLADWNGTDTGLNGQGVRYWLKGSVVTQVIVEDKTPNLRYDFGSSAHKSLHPIFVLTFYPGTNLGVKVEYILENMWTTKLQDQSYSLTLKTGNANTTTVYSKPLFTHIAQTRWHKTFWSGQAPQGWSDVGHPGIVINHNFPYLTSTMALPNFDQNFQLMSYDIPSTLKRFLASDRGDINGKGLWSSKFFGHIDDHTEATEVPKIYALYLYSFNPEMYDVLLGQADVASYIPVHLRESISGRFYDSAKTIDAFGMPISVNSRLTYRSVNSDSGELADRIISVGPVSNNGWQPEAAHQPSFAYVPYIITGDWYYGEEINFWSSYNLVLSNAYDRHKDWGILNKIQVRGEGRALRTLGHSAFISPDNTYEKSYFTEKLFNNIAVREGKHDIKDGVFYQPCATNPYNDATETSKWCWGRNTESLGAGMENPLHFDGHPEGFSRENLKPGASGYLGNTLELAKIADADHVWKLNFLQITYSHLTELGFPIRKLRDTVILNLLGQLQHPDYNPNLIEYSRIPTLRADGKYFDNWKDVKDAFVDSLENSTVMSPGNAYNVEARAAASFLPGINDGSLSGQAAWDFISSRTSPKKFPNWAWLPR